MELNFIEEFHRIDGTTVGERKYKLFKLLGGHKSYQGDSTFLHNLTEQLKPANYLEQVFYVDTLMFFRHTDGLLRCLIEGSDMAVSKIIKQKWFFQELYSKMPADVFIETIIPKLSYSVRVKVLKRLGQYLDGVSFDSVFETLALRYGMDRALPYLQFCSSDKISAIISTNSTLALNNEQLKWIFCKDPSIICKYFETYRLRQGREIASHNYANLLQFILNKNQNVFIELITKFRELYFQYGRRRTKKMCKAHPEYMLQQYISNSYCLNKQAFVRSLSMAEQITVLQSILPNSYCIDEWSIGHFCRYCPKNRRYSIYKAAFFNKHNCDIDSDPEEITEYVLNFNMPAAERDRLAQLAVKVGGKQFLKYLNINDSIPRILDIIKVTSNIDSREELLAMLFETCTINDYNLDALKRMLARFLDRHKNERLQAYCIVLKEVYAFGVQRFDDQTWKYVNQMWTNMRVKFDCNIGFAERIGYVRFLFNQQPSLIDQIIVECIQPECCNSFWLCIDDCPSMQRYICEFMLNNAPKYISHHNGLLKVDYALLDFIVTRNFDIDIWNHDRLRALLFMDKMVTYDNDKSIWKLIRNQRGPSTDLHAIFWKNVSILGTHSHFMWYLRHWPQELCDNFTLFATTLRNLDENGQCSHMFGNRLLKQIKLYAHLNLDRMLVDYSIKAISDTNKLQSKKSLFRNTATLLSTLEYVQWCRTSTYLPTTGRVTINGDATQQALYQTQCAIAHSFRFLRDQYAEALDVVLQFCVGDYLASALPSLACILYHLPEHCIGNAALDRIAAVQGVSIRKHALHYACELLPSTGVWQLFDQYATSVLEQPKNASRSMRKLLFEAALKYFCKLLLSNQQAFTYVKQFIQFLDMSDVDTIVGLPSMIPKLSNEYVAAYVELVWYQFAEKEDLPTWQDTQLKLDLLRATYDKILINQFSATFFQQIINKHFLNDRSNIVNELNTFTLHFLRYHPNAKLNFVFDLIDKRRKNSTTLWLRFFRESIATIATSDEVESGEQNDQFVSKYIEKWESYFKPMDYFYEFCMLRWFRIRCLTKSDMMPKQISDFWQSILSTYGPLIIDAFARVSFACLPWFTKCYSIIDDILFPVLVVDQASPTNNSPELCLLVLRLIANEVEPNLSSYFQQLISVLRSQSSPIVQIEVNMLLTELELRKK